MSLPDTYRYVDSLNLHLKFESRKGCFYSFINAILDVLNLLVARRRWVCDTSDDLQLRRTLTFPIIWPIEGNACKFQ